MAKEQGIPKLWEKIKEILNNLANKISKNGDTMTGTLVVNAPSAQVAINNVENGKTFLESSSQTGENVYLGGTSTQWYSHVAGQGMWRNASDDIGRWGIHKDGARVLHYDFATSEFVAPKMIASAGMGINFDTWFNFNASNSGTGWMIGEHSGSGYLKFLKTENGVGVYELIHLRPDDSIGIMGYTEFTKYINAYATINARTEGNSKIMSRGSASSWSGSARSNSGFHVGQDGGALAVPNGTSTFTKGYQIETVTDGLGYISRTSIGHLRSGTANWGSTVIYFEGDAEGQDAKHWWFHHTNGQFETNQLRVTGVSEFNTAMYSTAPSMMISNVTGMHLHSNSGLIGFLNSSGGWILHVDNAGNMVTISNTTAFSDIKLKKDLEIIPNAIEKIQAINGYTYTRKDTGERQAGVVAQEIQKVLPEVVLSNKDENGEETLSVAYGNIVSLLIEGIKEQQDKIDSLEERICKLEKLLEVV